MPVPSLSLSKMLTIKMKTASSKFEEKVETPLDEDNEPLKEGDHIWTMGLFP